MEVVGNALRLRRWWQYRAFDLTLRGAKRLARRHPNGGSSLVAINARRVINTRHALGGPTMTVECTTILPCDAQSVNVVW